MEAPSIVKVGWFGKGKGFWSAFSKAFKGKGLGSLGTSLGKSTNKALTSMIKHPGRTLGIGAGVGIGLPFVGDIIKNRTQKPKQIKI